MSIRRKKTTKLGPLENTESDTENSHSCYTLLNDIDTKYQGSESSGEGTPFIFRTPQKTPDELKSSYSPIDGPSRIAEVNEYEEKRLQRMQENMEVLKFLGVTDVRKLTQATHMAREEKKRVASSRKRKAANRKRALRRRAVTNVNTTRRKSLRLSKIQPVRYNPYMSYVEELKKNSRYSSRIKKIADRLKEEEVNQQMRAENGEESSNYDDDSDLLEEERKELDFIRSLEDRYYTCEEYFTLKGVKPELVQENGAFTGWVEETLRKKIGIAVDSEQAWEANGGGKFTFKTPTGVGNKGESAKETARKMLFKNPNSYFYRHTAPGFTHLQGDFTDEENKQFLKVAKEFGVGTKWGLFATYIRNRVGYQCSNHYRSHFVEGGIIWDGNFMLDKYGKSIYVGRKNRRLN